MKLKKIVLMLALVMSGTMFVACGGEKKADVVEKTEQTQTVDKKQEATKPYEPVEITDSSDYTVKISEKPQKIVSLAPSITEIVAALGAESRLVGRTDYCDYPESIKDSVAVGGTMDPTLEKIVELDPDLIITSTHTSKEIVEKLRELKIPTVFLNEQENFDGTFSAIMETGRMIGEVDKANELIKEMATKREKVQKAVNNHIKGGERKSIYFTNSFGENGDFAAGGDTFISEILELAGGSNIAKDVKGWQYSKEKLIEQDPDIIIVPSGMDLKKQLSELEGYKDLTAVKNGQVFEIDGNMISRQGPRIDEALEEVTKIINPDMKYE
ncbi:MAG: ABC transporter substrate-binding protein [Sarcina sp.]